jgi:hypothetical protein
LGKLRFNSNITWAQTVIIKRLPNAQQPYFSDLTFPYKLFPFWRPIETEKGDGIISIAAINYRGKLVKLTGYEHYMNIMQMGALNKIEHSFAWYSDGNIATSSNAVQYLKVRVIAQDPTELETWDEATSAYIPAYDPTVDPYPVSGELLDDMFRIWLQLNGVTLQMPSDTTDNQMVDKSKPQISQQQ